jgi:penicillin-binding protein 1C
VELLAHLGPERFTSALEHAGLRLRLPATGRPNLAVILGGTATSLEELVGAYAALGRAGLAGRVRLRPEEPLAERYLLSPQAAWIIRQILIEHGRPEEGTAGLHPGRRQRIAWKTGTSYGFRDAWAIGSTPDLVIGVWIGRPDGTPLPGSFGAASALPLLFQLADALPRRRPTVDPPPPPGVAELPVCWPLGGLARDTPPELCHRRFDAWVRRDLVPPTLPERRGGDWQPAVVEFWREPSSGARLNASCLTADARPARIARWPRLAYPWLSPRLRRLATLPELARSCRGEDRRGERLVIEGLDPGARLRAPANLARPVELALRVLGTSAEVDWLLDGRRIARQRGGTWFHLRLDQAGRHRLVVIDRDGRWSAVDFEVVESRPALLAGSEP